MTDIGLDIKTDPVNTAKGSGVVGMRAFSVDDRGRLGAVSNRYIYTPGENVTKPSPTQDYNDFYSKIRTRPWHGFYSFYDGSTPYYDDDKKNSVLGVIDNYGDVLIGKRGLRSEKARVLGIVVPSVSNTWAYLSRVLGGLFVAAFIAMMIVGLVINSIGVGVAMFFGGIVLAAGTIFIVSYPKFKKKNDGVDFDAIKYAYGDNIQYFKSKDDMLKAYPLYKNPSLVPSNPDFWK